MPALTPAPRSARARARRVDDGSGTTGRRARRLAGAAAPCRVGRGAARRPSPDLARELRAVDRRVATLFRLPDDEVSPDIDDRLAALGDRFGEIVTEIANTPAR